MCRGRNFRWHLRNHHRRAVQAGLLTLSAIVIVIVLVALCYTVALSLKSEPCLIVETMVVDATLGLSLGWVAIATAACIIGVLLAF
ncbi:hypothetical protein [Subtercola lobariae]|uniref:Uncharacterized protein n=1 Tax=Subtercola lobariae TaxID=1588641 RepID=A0A917EXF4_9MICO|nr:hypothetical protein [Subtercola lobariae]GGF19420.1 hypothetical protein GCM10011399_11280 [Subtercola lobariae]